MPKTDKEKLLSAQKIIQDLNRQLKLSKKVIQERGKKILEFQAQGKAYDMWMAYFLERYGKDGELRIKRDELYRYKNAKNIAGRIDKKSGEIILRRSNELSNINTGR